MILRLASAFALIAAATTLYFSRTANFFEIEKTVTVEASTEKIYALISNLENWKKWSEFSKENLGIVEIVSKIPEKELLVNLNYTTPIQQKLRYSFYTHSLGLNKSELKIVCKGDLDLMKKVIHKIFNVNRLIEEQLSQEIDHIKKIAEYK